jgi:hypothetical protein
VNDASLTLKVDGSSSATASISDVRYTNEFIEFSVGGLPQPACAGPCGDGRDLLCAAHRLLLECVAGDDDLFLVFGAPALSGMGGGRRVRGVLARRPAGL